MNNTKQTGAEALRTQTKEKLREAIATYQGDITAAPIQHLIQQLADLNPTPAPALSSTLLDGNWCLISAPNFPNGARQPDGSYHYTLGRLAFNMFQPMDLLVAIDRVWQPVLPTETHDHRTHDIVVEFTVVDPRMNSTPPLQGIVRNLGVCHPISDTSLQVQFTGGSLEPLPYTDRSTWDTVFNPLAAPRFRSLKDRLMQWSMKQMLGLVAPQSIQPDTGRQDFQMQRSPKGSLTILYLDHELRITRGHRETVLICERLTPTHG